MRLIEDHEVELEPLKERAVAIIGYGNQGRAQALNLRDSGIDVQIGSVRDAGAERAEADGFSCVSIESACDNADVLALLIPDEVQRAVYDSTIAPRLRAGHVLDFAHGYNVHFGHIRAPSDVDVVMVAPRMIGAAVRTSFERGKGAPCYVAVEQDASGNARDIALAFAKGIGATRAGVLETTFALETELDLFAEQGVWPIIMRDMIMSFEVLVEAGFPPEMVTLELWGSGEASEIFKQMARRGIVNQMRLHSQTSQYGTMSRGERMLSEDARDRLRAALAEIRSGKFAQEWADEQAAGYPNFHALRDAAEAHPVNEAELLGREMIERAGLLTDTE
ncbi:MAG: ketol-acid reductoisomerase [Gammaproteobacteria bacterium]|jgi:ketol-acid reductoisomerase